MILLCGIPSESPVAMVREALGHLGAATIVFNQRQFASAHFSFAMAQGRVTGELVIEEQPYDLDEITGVYTRLIDEQALPELRSWPAQAPE